MTSKFKVLCFLFTFVRADSDEHLNRHFFKPQNVNATNAPINISTSTFKFGPSGSVIVNKGVTLNVNTTTLTSVDCNVMWGGIFVWGTPSALQTVSSTAQGKLIIRNSLVENAHNAVNNWAGLLKTGGIINATNTTFKNNRIGIRFFPYNHASRSYVRNCTFQTTAPMKDAAMYPSPNNGHLAFIWIYLGAFKDVGAQITFSGNTFETLASSGLTGTARGKGFFTTDVVYNVQKSAYSNANSFTNLDVGIDANQSLNTTTLSNIYAQNSFNNCRVGIQVTGNGGGYSIKGNTFTQQAFPLHLGATGWSMGVFANGAGTVDVWQSNVFTKMTIGTYFANTGSITNDGTNNNIWKNTFTDCFYSVQTQGVNSKTLITCNTFESPNNQTRTYWRSFAGNIKTDQGSCNSSETLANNQFLHTPLLGYDIAVGSGTIFNYNFSGDLDPSRIYTPSYQNSTTAFNNLGGCQMPIDCNVNITACPGTFISPKTCQSAPQFKLKPENEIAQELANTTDKEKRMELIREMILAKIENNAPDQVISFLQSVPDTEAKWMLVPEFIKEKRFTDAETTLNNLAKDNLERQKRDEYYKVHIDLGKTDRIPTDMTAAEKTTVDAVAASETEISHNAKAMLHFWFNEEFMPDTAGMSPRLA